jgi:hypothetical protein
MKRGAAGLSPERAADLQDDDLEASIAARVNRFLTAF